MNNNDPLKLFYQEKQERINAQGQDAPLKAAADEFTRLSLKSGYSYNFSWLGRPVIQYPQDMAAMQEIIWQVKPRLIVETGVAHGGSAIFHASMLELIGGPGKVLAIDIDVRAHNRPLIEGHPMSRRLELLEGDSTGPAAASRARALAAEAAGPVMAVLDSCHSHGHVLEELELYSPLVTPGSYLVVFDGLVEQFPEESVAAGRPWGAGDNPLTATREFLKTHPEFEADRDIENKLLITAAPEGWLKRKGGSSNGV
ncbi:cephalosporin hydroxylase (plasmid) [Deltaproteobacteria bacterium Smac51]|nr:cephalosporin hydroxylase [Deltaproteobacteria bacterium Smac51]